MVFLIVDDTLAACGSIVNIQRIELDMELMHI